MDSQKDRVLIFNGQWSTDCVLFAEQSLLEDALEIGCMVTRNRPRLGIMRQGYLC